MNFEVGDFVVYTDKKEEYSGRVVEVVNEDIRKIEIYVNEELGLDAEKMILEVNKSMLTEKDFTKQKKRRRR